MSDIYEMRRGGKVVAEVVHVGSGKAVVSWPTSVIVYDSLDAARAVHIDHMGGRGERTEFRPIASTRSDFMRGVENAGLDENENACWGTLTLHAKFDGELRCPNWAALVDPVAFVDGYLAVANRWEDEPTTRDQVVIEGGNDE